MRRSGLAMLVVALVAACSSTPPPTASSTGSGSAAPPSFAPAVTATPAYTDSRPATTPAPTVVTTPTAAPSPTPTVEPTVSSAEPPAAALFVGPASDATPGRLGSYTFAGMAVDGRWLPARIMVAVNVPAGGSLTVRFPDGSSINGWGARYAAAADEQAVVVRGLGSGEQPNLMEISFPAPPNGDWVIAVSLGYPADLGKGEYYWHVRVGP